MTVEQDVLAILERSTVEGNVLVLPFGQLERKQYERVNKVLEVMGGKWSRKSKGHVFECDPLDLVDAAMLTGEVVDEKKQFQFFPTPKTVAAKMVQMAEIGPSDSVLEPSAGNGAIAWELFKVTHRLTLIELNPKYAAELAFQYNPVIAGDFLDYDDRTHTRIVMNPPFTRQQDADHILHALDILAPDGILVSVVSESPFFRQNPKSILFRATIESFGAEMIDLPEGTFAGSGTNIKTRILKVRKGKLVGSHVRRAR